jgi:hypothetical protein
MEWLRAGYTEVWVPAAVVPLVQFAGRVRGLASTGLDLVGIEGIDVPRPTAEALAQFDEIVSWYGANRPEFRETALHLNPNWRFLPVLPPGGTEQHVTDFYAHAAGAPLGLQARLSIPHEPKRRAAVIQPFSGGREKNWPLDRFRKLAGNLPVSVEWIVGPEEELPGATRIEDLWQLAKHIASAAVYIGNDSGITHLAAATGVPTVALFGSTDARVWAPRGNNVTVVCGESMHSIDVHIVSEVVTCLLEGGL